MLKQKISYTDYNGNTREDEYEFNLTRSEVIRMNVGFKGGLIPFFSIWQAAAPMWTVGIWSSPCRA